MTKSMLLVLTESKSFEVPQLNRAMYLSDVVSPQTCDHGSVANPSHPWRCPNLPNRTKSFSVKQLSGSRTKADST